jgi:hypothetical protein
MQKIVEEHCTGATATWVEPADVMRDLDIQVQLSPLAWSWLPFAPLEPKRAEKAVAAASKRLDLDEGLFEPPESPDELAARRRSTRSSR